jgi:hypothetical protein
MTTTRRTWGQFATPPDLADLLLGFCLRRSTDRLLDPSCGEGALLGRAARWQTWQDEAPDPPPGTLYGVELDAAAAARAAQALPGAHFTVASFFALQPDAFDPFDAIIGNPPYTRAEWIDRLPRGVDAQLSLFPDAAGAAGDAAAPDRVRRPVVPHAVWSPLGGRSGLFAYFLLHSLGFLREGGRLGFVVPNGWLDVAYGRQLKQFLLNHFRIVAVVESAVERWFDEASVNTCLLILEKASLPEERAANRVRFARLRLPLHELLGGPDDAERVTLAEQVLGRLLPSADRHSPSASVHVVAQGELDAAARWGAYLRAPEVVWRRALPDARPLGAWATVQRGYTTGANGFFYLQESDIASWGIEAGYRRPLLKSLRGVNRLVVGPADCSHQLLAVPAEGVPTTSGAERYIEWGESQGFGRLRTCAARRPWYALPQQEPARLLLPKGVWQRHFAPLLDGDVAVDQQLYQVRLAAGVSPRAAAALLNSAWFALQCEVKGRLNFGDGVLWLAAYELEEMRLPDPRALDPRMLARLEMAFDALGARPVGETEAELDLPDRRALDELVFDILGLSAAEREAVRDGLRAALDGRRQRAGSVGGRSAEARRG